MPSFILAVEAPFKHLCFWKLLKAYEKVDETISKVAIQKFKQHLWYLTDEVVFSFLDDVVDHEMIANFVSECFLTYGKRYIPSSEELCGSVYG